MGGLMILFTLICFQFYRLTVWAWDLGEDSSHVEPIDGWFQVTAVSAAFCCYQWILGND